MYKVYKSDETFANDSKVTIGLPHYCTLQQCHIHQEPRRITLHSHHQSSVAIFSMSVSYPHLLFFNIKICEKKLIFSIYYLYSISPYILNQIRCLWPMFMHHCSLSNSFYFLLSHITMEHNLHWVKHASWSWIILSNHDYTETLGYRQLNTYLAHNRSILVHN